MDGCTGTRTRTQTGYPQPVLLSTRTVAASLHAVPVHLLAETSGLYESTRVRAGYSLYVHVPTRASRSSTSTVGTDRYECEYSL